MKKLLSLCFLLFATLAIPAAALAQDTPVAARTSASAATPYTSDVTLGSKTFAGYTLHSQVASDNTFVTLYCDSQIVLTEAMFQSPFILDWSKATPPCTERTSATHSQFYERFRVEAQTPVGLPKISAWSNVISKTDAVVPAILDSNHKTTNMVLSNGNLTATSGGGGGPDSVYTNRGITSGRKVYFEAVITTLGSTSRIALTDGVPSLTSWWDSGQGIHAFEWTNSISGLKYNGTSQHPDSSYDFTTGDRLEFAVDTTIGAQKIWVRKNGGAWLGGGDPVAGTSGFALTGIGGGGELFPAVQSVTSAVATFAFLSASWVHSAPSGYVAMWFGPWVLLRRRKRRSANDNHPEEMAA